MMLELSLEGLNVLLLGEPGATRQALARYRREGAVVAHLASPAAFLRAGLPGRVSLVAVVAPSVRPGAGGRVHDGVWQGIVDHYRAAGVPVVREPAAGSRGVVTLVGGGCGAEGLLTRDALDALRDADVVLYDRLGPWESLPALSTAELVDVGKLPGHHKVPQEEINALLVEQARAGANVVRLKGGDPYVFGRGSEELDACTAANVPVRVVSGVSSAIAVPAAAGIPVTQRGVSHCFTVISGHAPLSSAEHAHLAGLGGTLVVLMGVANLPHLAAGLRRAGMANSTPLAVIERGHHVDQRVTLTELGRAERDTAGCGNPAVIVIGDVVRQAPDSGARLVAHATAVDTA
ncbi:MULTISPECIES: uroporphyrinogen-III C-methyltransferase [Arthrobacter]|uniref:uroporphyrinogen-III C-methyltransferase n=2 Tax=Arthrobacter TaxID=1663 RepID=A0ABU9KNF0_9MICC|nr:uroporphyrinogen-III C-methyltransferase [Arthrobacter sp. YJM1]MDP5228259.1 uroporphyrinogen-III C-methyltransferase [Arthrobacter sp. YJM1]